MLLYNNGNTLIYLYLDLQSEYYQLSLHFFFDPGLATDRMKLMAVLWVRMQDLIHDQAAFTVLWYSSSLV
jgi:hypothetical protein